MADDSICKPLDISTLDATDVVADVTAASVDTVSVVAAATVVALLIAVVTDVVELVVFDETDTEYISFAPNTTVKISSTTCSFIVRLT